MLARVNTPATSQTAEMTRPATAILRPSPVRSARRRARNETIRPTGPPRMLRSRPMGASGLPGY
ncbi:hypothetical protein Ato02nite_070110 [Paractinoplanes toevensis]|uniref:Uncharacterized protein n=1 Tax=Paractinoplanes toevensis TaxID=571911 RepID=A0A919TGZ1_9ACTN|nr:hypothetical protein Ato02nite_070110 [Actinoplanes toevensis]